MPETLSVCFDSFDLQATTKKNCTDQHNFILVAKTSLLARDVLQCEHQTRRVTSVFDFSGSNSRLWLVTLTRSRKHETAMHMCLDTEPGANTGRAKKFRSKLLGSLLGDDWSSMQSTAIYVDVVWCSEQAILLVFQLLWLTRQGNALRYWLLPLRLSVRHLQALFGEVPATALSAGVLAGCALAGAPFEGSTGMATRTCWSLVLVPSQLLAASSPARTREQEKTCCNASLHSTRPGLWPL